MIVSCDTNCDNCHLPLLDLEWIQVMACSDGNHVVFKHLDCDKKEDPLEQFEPYISGTLF